MKTNRMNRILLLMALMGGMVAGCQPLEEIDSREIVEENDSREIVDENVVKDGYTLTVEAVKKVDTKALIRRGDVLNAQWKAGEKVGVYVNGTYAGQLTAKTPNNNSNTRATLSGTLTNAAGIAPGASIFLLYPDRTDIDIQEATRWDYTGQTSYFNDVSSAYDYATATLTVSGIHGNEVTTTGVATFQNEQSVYCFNFSHFITEFTIFSNQNKLVTSRSYAGQWTSAFGPLTVANPQGGDGINLFVSIRNENTTVTDRYSFLAMTSEGILYFGTKEIETQNLGNGKYLKPSVSLSQPDFTSIEGTYTGNIL